MLQVALLSSIAYFLCYGCNLLIGQAMTDRPLVAGAVAGLLLGDPAAGCIIGAELEAVFMGSVNIGGQISADHTAATILAVAFATNQALDSSAALTLAIPIGVLMGFVTMLVNNVFLTVLVPWIDRDASDSKEKGLLYGLNFGVWFAKNLFFAAVVFAGVYVGASAVSAFVDSIPPVVMTSLTVCGQLLPAVGLALLMKMIWDKGMWIFYLLGFVVFNYLGIPVVAIAILGIILTVIICNRDLQMNKLKKEMSESRTSAVEVDEVEDFLC